MSSESCHRTWVSHDTVDANARQCGVCGCLEGLACERGCAQVAVDLCSACDVPGLETA